MLLNIDGKEVQFLGGTLDYFGRYLPIQYLWQKNDNLRSEKRLFWGCGAALAIRRAAIERVGGFDPNLPTDEVDLCWRINLNGGKIVLAPRAIVYHYGSASFGSSLNALRVFYSEISLLTSFIRNFELWSVIRAFFFFFSFLPIAFAFDVIVRRRIDVLMCRAKASFHVLRNLSTTFSQRTLVQKKIRKVKESEIRKLMVKPNPMLYLRHSQRA